VTLDGGSQLGESGVEEQRRWRGADGCFARRKQVRLCLNAERIRAGWTRRTWPTSAAQLRPPARG
jgi:hypothetical protein